MNKVVTPQHKALNRVFAGSRVWSIQWPGTDARPMVAVEPSSFMLDPADDNPDAGKDHLMFGDTSRGRLPTFDLHHVAPDEIRLTFNWRPEEAIMRPMGLAEAQQIPEIAAHFDLAGLTPGDEYAEEHFRTFVK
jgi:hypothetical protein